MPQVIPVVPMKTLDRMHAGVSVFPEHVGGPILIGTMAYIEKKLWLSLCHFPALLWYGLTPLCCHQYNVIKV